MKNKDSFRQNLFGFLSIDSVVRGIVAIVAVILLFWFLNTLIERPVYSAGLFFIKKRRLITQPSLSLVSQLKHRRVLHE